MREQFEKLPEIKAQLEYCRYSANKNKYVSHWYNTMFINGAWYAYQEQQKKIDQLVDIINTGLRIEHNMNNQIHSLKEKIELLEQFKQDILK